MTTLEGNEKMVKLSSCPVCNGIIRAAAADYINENTKARNEFMREVMKYNLTVSEITLPEYQSRSWCKCSSKSSNTQTPTP